MSNNENSMSKKNEKKNNSPNKNLLLVNILKEAQNHHISLKENISSNPFLEIYDSEREEVPVNLSETDQKFHIKDFLHPMKKDPIISEHSLCTFDPLYRSENNNNNRNLNHENIVDTQTAEFSENQQFRIPLNLWTQEIKRRLIESIAFIDNVIYTTEDAISKNEVNDQLNSQEIIFFNKIKKLNKNLVNMLEDFKKDNNNYKYLNDCDESIYTTKVHQMKSSIADLTKLHNEVKEKDRLSSTAGNFSYSSDIYKTSMNNSSSQNKFNNVISASTSEKEKLDNQYINQNEIIYYKKKLMNREEEIETLKSKIYNLENLLNSSAVLVDEIYSKNRLLQNKLIKYKSIAEQSSQFKNSKHSYNSNHNFRY